MRFTKQIITLVDVEVVFTCFSNPRRMSVVDDAISVEKFEDQSTDSISVFTALVMEFKT